MFKYLKIVFFFFIHLVGRHKMLLIVLIFKAICEICLLIFLVFMYNIHWKSFHRIFPSEGNSFDGWKFPVWCGEKLPISVNNFFFHEFKKKKNYFEGNIKKKSPISNLHCLFQSPGNSSTNRTTLAESLIN